MSLLGSYLKSHHIAINKIADDFRTLVKKEIEIKAEITDSIEDFEEKRKFVISNISIIKTKKMKSLHSGPLNVNASDPAVRIRRDVEKIEKHCSYEQIPKQHL